MTPETKAKVLNIVAWILAVLLALMFLNTGITKFTSAGWADRMVNWGYPGWFRYVIGTAETLFALGLLWPKMARYAAGGLIVVMIGAAITHLIHGEINWSFNLILIALLGIVVYIRRPPSHQKSPTPA